MTDEFTIESLPEGFGNSEDLPSLPAVAIEVLRLARDEEATVEDLAKVISRYPALSAKILKLANSSHFRRRNDITTLEKATVMLGMKTVKLMALSFSLVSKLPQQGASNDFDYVEYWRHSLATAVNARAFARLVKNRFADEAFLCGLLGRIGQLNDLNHSALGGFGLTEQEVESFVVGLEDAVAETAALLNVDFSDTDEYVNILEDALSQVIQISLDTAIDLEESTTRTAQLEREKEELEAAANTDKLTGLPNRAAFDSMLTQVVAARLRGHAANSLGILVLDVDHFKKFNDEYGHLAGDEVLKGVSGALSRSTRRTDFAARYGGEEFVVILPNATALPAPSPAMKLAMTAEIDHAELPNWSVRIFTHAIS